MAPTSTHDASSCKSINTSKQDERKRVAIFLSPIVFAFFSLVFTNIPLPLAYFQRTESSPALVYDNVLSPEMCQALHNEALYVKDKSQGSMVVVFHWPLHQKASNGVEHAIDSILTQMYGTSPEKKFIVEYWEHPQWRHTKAHPDIDGVLLFNHGVMKNPYKGHVLYLKKGTQVNGPTVVFPNVTTGGEMYDSAAQNQQEVIIVPIVEGRLLQFQGNVLHAVPRPVDAWLHPSSETSFVHEPFEMYGRSVILFNLWEKIPTGADFSYEIFNDENDDTEQTNCSEQDGRISSFTCNPKSEWKSASVVNDWKETLFEYISSKRSVFTLPLMGFESWRGTTDAAVEMHATPHVERALVSSDLRPKRVYLEVPPTRET